MRRKTSLQTVHVSLEFLTDKVLPMKPGSARSPIRKEGDAYETRRPFLSIDDFRLGKRTRSF